MRDNAEKEWKKRCNDKGSAGEGREEDDRFSGAKEVAVGSTFAGGKGSTIFRITIALKKWTERAVKKVAIAIARVR